MLQYHVSCGLSKKVIAIDEEGCSKQKICNKVSTAFNVEEAAIIAIQVFNQEWDDWLDIEDELPPSKSKLQVVVEERPVKVDEMGQSADTAAQAEDVQVEQPMSGKQTPSTSSTWHLVYTLPAMPSDVRNLLKANDRAVLSRKWRNKIVQVLFEDVVQFTLYPSSQQYNEVSRVLVRKYPILQDRAHNASGHDTWKESLRNKFKHERAPLMDEGVIKRKSVYGQKRQKPNVEKAPSPVKKTKRSSLEDGHSGEDDRSLKKHIEDLKLLSARRKPDMDVIADKMARTRHHRQKMIAECPVLTVLEEFPVLKSEVQILKELQCSYGGQDVHRCLLKTIANGAKEIIKQAESVAACKSILQLFRGELENTTDDKKEQELTVTASCLLIPLLMGEKDQTYVIDKEPTVPTPALVIKGNPFDTQDLSVKMDGAVLCTSSNVSLGVAATFAAFYVFGVQYPRQGKNTLLFYQQHLAGLDRNKALPAKVQRFINSISL